TRARWCTDGRLDSIPRLLAWLHFGLQPPSVRKQRARWHVGGHGLGPPPRSVGDKRKRHHFGRRCLTPHLDLQRLAGLAKLHGQIAHGDVAPERRRERAAGDLADSLIVVPHWKTLARHSTRRDVHAHQSPPWAGRLARRQSLTTDEA